MIVQMQHGSNISTQMKEVFTKTICQRANEETKNITLKALKGKEGEKAMYKKVRMNILSVLRLKYGYFSQNV